MTDLPAPPPPRDPDELASDVVDGLLPLDEAAAVQRDPAVALRVEQILQARTALRSTPPIDAPAADRAIAAAVDAFDPHGTSAGATTADSPAGSPPPPALRSVSGTGAAGPAVSSHRDAGRLRSIRPWLAAAAAVLVALATVGILARSDDEDADQTAAGSADAEAETTEQGQPAEGGGDEEGGAGSAPRAPGAAEDDSSSAESEARTQADTSIVELGEVSGSQELALRARLSLAEGQLSGAVPDGAVPPVAGEGVESCPGLSVTGDPSRGAPVLVGDATLDGNPVRVHVYQSGDQRQLVATDHSCTDVVDESLDR